MDILSPSNYLYNPHAIPPLITGLLILLLGVFVLSKNIKDSKNRVFFAFTISIATWQISSFCYHSAINADLGYIWIRYILFAGISFIHVHPYYFSVLILDLKKQRKFAALGYILGLIFYILQATTGGIVTHLEPTYWGYSGILGPFGPLYILFFYVYATALAVNCYLGYRRAATDAERLKLKYLFIGLLVAIFGSMDFIAMSGIKIYQFGYIFVDFLAVIMAYTIVRHRLLDIETVAHKTLLWITTSISIVFPIFILVILLRKWVETLTNIQRTIFYAIVFFALLLIYKRLQPMIDHLFDRRRYNAEDVFIKFIKDIALIKGVEELADKIINTLSNVFYTDKITLVLCDEDCKRYLLVKGIDVNRNHIFDPPLLEWLKKYNDVIEVEQIDIDPKYSNIKEAAKVFFDGLGARIFIPIVFYERLLGFITLGRKRNLKSYTLSDLNLLSMFRMEAAVALSNSITYTALQEYKKELEEKVKERTEELTRTYLELKKEHEKTKEIARLKSLFIANISHELRTPLSAIIGFTELLQGKDFGPLTEKQEKYVDSILNRSKHLLQLINNILDFSEIEAGKMPVAATDFFIADLLNEAVENILPIAAKKEIKVTTEFEDNLPQVSADYAKVIGVMDNLLSNAVKFTPMGGSINVKARHILPSAGRQEAGSFSEVEENEGSGYIYVSVEDNGIGVKKEDLKRIFDVFEQVDNSYTKEYQGTGLGLAIAKKYIELHRGRMWVESESGKGSRFNFIIPEKLAAGFILKKTIFDVYRMLHGIISMLSYELEARKVEIDLKCAWSFQYRIPADKELIRGIVINIINNAIRYSPERSKVIVELKSLDGRYIISIGNKWNNDYGVVPSLFFDPSEECNLKDRVYFNLSKSREIIEAHGGFIFARNDMANRMTWVDISLPE